jgi:DNA-binding NtrC family response regulator
MDAKILILEDDDDLRAAVADVVSGLMGWRYLGVGSFDELVARRTAALECRLAILDLTLSPGEPSGLDAYAWLRQQGFRGKVVFLTGHAPSHPLVRRALATESAAVVEKPIDLAQLSALLGEAQT